MVLKDLLERIIQRQDLSQAEASLLMEEIVEGRLTSAQIAAFLVALRMKGESADEIAGLASVMRQKVERVASKHEHLVDTCGTGGDGGKTFNVSTLAALVTAGAGVPVAKHGNVAVSSRCGSADLLKGLGVNVEADRSVMERALNETGICFLYAPRFHPAMKHVAGPRKEIGVRTIFNILGPLTNPAGAKAQVIGVFRKDLVELLARVLLKLGSRHAFVVHGEDGLDEVTTTTETSVTQLKEGKVSSFCFVPEELGLKRCLSCDIQGGDLSVNLKIAKSVLAGEKGPCRDIVVLNAAFAIVAGSGAPSLGEGLKKAENAIDSGAADQKLKALIEYTHKS